jgi:hydrogenase expression/formation protein HypC
MCIAIPRQVVAVLDAAGKLVAVDDGASGQDVASVAFLVTPERPIEQLVGAFVLIHAGFAISVIDEAEARSRLHAFAALRGEEDAFDLSEFYAAAANEAAAARSHGADKAPDRREADPAALG